jgi:hypothetical protein
MGSYLLRTLVLLQRFQLGLAERVLLIELVEILVGSDVPVPPGVDFLLIM